MKDIFYRIIDPYTPVGEKDILWEIMRMEEEHGTVYNDAELQSVFRNDAATISRQIDAIAKPVPASCKYTSDASNSC
jgi:hypothetical protein